MLSYRFFHQLFSDPKGTFDEAMDSGPLKKAFFAIASFSLSISLALFTIGLATQGTLLLKATAMGFVLTFIASTLFFILLIPIVLTLVGVLFKTEITFKKAALASSLPLSGYIPLIWLSFILISLVSLMGESSSYLLAVMSPLIGALAMVSFVWAYCTSFQLLKHAFGLSLFATLWVIAAPFILIFYASIFINGIDHSSKSIKESMNEAIEKIEKEENFIAGKISSEIGTENLEEMETSNPDVERYPPDNISEEVKNRPRDEFNISEPTSDTDIE